MPAINNEARRRLEYYWNKRQAGLNGRLPSQSEASRAMGYSRAVLNHLLQGRQPITEDAAQRIAAYLGIDPEDILGSVKRTVVIDDSGGASSSRMLSAILDALDECGLEPSNERKAKIITVLMKQGVGDKRLIKQSLELMQELLGD